MARGDTGKWVARAAATGGGRTYRGQMPVRWYGSLFLIVLLGVALIVYSRYERQHPAASAQPAIGTHWYAALAFDHCGAPEQLLAANSHQATAAPGLYTTGDGVIQIAPSKSADAGSNATFGRFVKLYPHLNLTASSVGLPGKSTLRDGQKCPAGTPDAGKVGTLRVKVWPDFVPPGVNNPTIPSDPSSLKLANGQLITVFFGPSSAKIPEPSQQVISTLLQDRQSSTTTTTTPVATTTTPPAATTTTTTPATTTTTAPTTTTTTTRPATTTTHP